MVEIPTKTSNVFIPTTFKTGKISPYFPSGKMVVVIPEPPGQVNSRPFNLIGSSFENPCASEVMVIIPTVLS